MVVLQERLVEFGARRVLGDRLHDTHGIISDRLKTIPGIQKQIDVWDQYHSPDAIQKYLTDTDNALIRREELYIHESWYTVALIPTILPAESIKAVLPAVYSHITAASGPHGDQQAVEENILRRMAEQKRRSGGFTVKASGDTAWEIHAEVLNERNTGKRSPVVRIKIRPIGDEYLEMRKTEHMRKQKIKDMVSHLSPADVDSLVQGGIRKSYQFESRILARITDPGVDLENIHIALENTDQWDRYQTEKLGEIEERYEFQRVLPENTQDYQVYFRSQKPQDADLPDYMIVVYKTEAETALAVILSRESRNVLRKAFIEQFTGKVEDEISRIMERAQKEGFGDLSPRLIFAEVLRSANMNRIGRQEFQAGTTQHERALRDLTPLFVRAMQHRVPFFIADFLKQWERSIEENRPLSVGCLRGEIFFGQDRQIGWVLQPDLHTPSFKLLYSVAILRDSHQDKKRTFGAFLSF